MITTALYKLVKNIKYQFVYYIILRTIIEKWQNNENFLQSICHFFAPSKLYPVATYLELHRL